MIGSYVVESLVSKDDMGSGNLGCHPLLGCREAIKLAQVSNATLSFSVSQKLNVKGVARCFPFGWPWSPFWPQAKLLLHPLAVALGCGVV
ncbi:MAG: hypothetical protein ACK42L_08955 [Thermoanaerobaculum sp.]